MRIHERLIAALWACGIACGTLYAIFVMPHEQTASQWQRICQMDSFHPDITQRERETCQALRRRKL